MNARRTAVRLTFAGVDISTDINKHLLSLTYTDNEEDKTDDLQLSLDDREGVWLGNWLNTPGASKGVGKSPPSSFKKNWESNGERPCA
jgi:phage protein D